MDFEISAETETLLEELETFLESEIDPLVDEHPDLYGHRREAGRTNWADGTPTEAWTTLLGEMTRRADEAGFYRLQLPEKLGGRDCGELTLALVREYLGRRGPPTDTPSDGLMSIVGNFDIAKIIHRYGDKRQIERYVEPLISGELHSAFGLTEPDHGSDATYMETTAEWDGDKWVLDGAKRYISQMHRADVVLIFARTDGADGDHEGITGFLVPTDTAGLEVPHFNWTMMMPTDAAEIDLDDVRVPPDAVVGDVGAGLQQAQHFVHEGRIRQAAESLGAAQFAIDRCVEFVKERETWGEPLSTRQAIQFPLADLQSEAELVRSLLYRTAWMLDQEGTFSIDDKVSMVNYRANQLACDALDQAIQIHGGQGYSRDQPFEYLYRYFRRYRITEGTDEIQKRIVAGHLLGFI